MLADIEATDAGTFGIPPPGTALLGGPDIAGTLMREFDVVSTTY